MNIDTPQTTINIAPINLAPHEETVIKDALSSVNVSVGKETRSYALVNKQSAKDAQILVVNLKASNIKHTRQLLHRIYGAKSTVFIVSDLNSIPQTDYKYLINQKDLSQDFIDLLDSISLDELDYQPKPANNTATKVSYTIGFDKSKQTGEFIGRVLIVDDSPSVRTQMNLYLNKRKFECHLVENSEEAIRAIKQTKFDLIFLDVMMPGVDGYQACKAIKSFESTKQVPVILLTSKNSPIDKIHGIMSGCDKYLTKPVRSSELDSLLSSYFPAFKYIAVNQT